MLLVQYQKRAFIVIKIHSIPLIYTIQESNRNTMNLNMKQQTLQYHTIPDGGDDDVVVLEHQQEKSTGRTYSVLVGLVLLLVAAAVVLQGGGRPYYQAGSSLDGVFDTPPTSAEGMVLASITTLRNNDEEKGCFMPCLGGCCGANCCL